MKKSSPQNGFGGKNVPEGKRGVKDGFGMKNGGSLEISLERIEKDISERNMLTNLDLTGITGQDEALFEDDLDDKEPFSMEDVALMINYQNQNGQESNFTQHTLGSQNKLQGDGFFPKDVFPDYEPPENSSAQTLRKYLKPNRNILKNTNYKS